jgi:hypothetical protein
MAWRTRTRRCRRAARPEVRGGARWPERGCGGLARECPRPQAQVQADFRSAAPTKGFVRASQRAGARRGSKGGCPVVKCKRWGCSSRARKNSASAKQTLDWGWGSGAWDSRARVRGSERTCEPNDLNRRLRRDERFLCLSNQRCERVLPLSVRSAGSQHHRMLPNLPDLTQRRRSANSLHKMCNRPTSMGRDGEIVHRRRRPQHRVITAASDQCRPGVLDPCRGSSCRRGRLRVRRFPRAKGTHRGEPLQAVLHDGRHPWETRSCRCRLSCPHRDVGWSL